MHIINLVVCHVFQCIILSDGIDKYYNVLYLWLQLFTRSYKVHYYCIKITFLMHVKRAPSKVIANDQTPKQPISLMSYSLKSTSCNKSTNHTKHWLTVHTHTSHTELYGVYLWSGGGEIRAQMMWVNLGHNTKQTHAHT